MSDKFEEKSMQELGYIANFEEKWKTINQRRKLPLRLLLRHLIENRKRGDIEVHIGGVVFHCHCILLKIYSTLFKALQHEAVIQLPPHQISPEIFRTIYDWILSDQTYIPRENIIDLLNGAHLLRINDLCLHINMLLSDDRHFVEDAAFMLYLEARERKLFDLEHIMMWRITKFFLPLVASTDYVLLELDKVLVLLRSNYIGVNIEMEVFLSAIRWINYSYSDRIVHIMELMDSVRFSLLPPWYLVQLKKEVESVEIARIVAIKPVLELIESGLSCASLMQYYADEPTKLSELLNRNDFVRPQQRVWILDEHCSYHHGLNCENKQFIKYKQFTNYLNHLQINGVSTFKKFALMTSTQRCGNCYKEIKPANSVDSNEQSDHCSLYFATESTQNSVTSITNSVVTEYEAESTTDIQLETVSSEEVEYEETEFEQTSASERA